MKGDNLVPIPGELNSVAVGGVVSSAEGIYDYVQGKNQEDINKELIVAGSQLARSVQNLQNNNDGLSETINETVNARLEAAQVEMDAAISENQQAVTRRLNENEAKMSELKNATDAILLDNQNTRNAIASLSPDQQGAIALGEQVNDNTNNIREMEDQLGGYSIKVVTENQYNNLVALGNTDTNTLYFVRES